MRWLRWTPLAASLVVGTAAITWLTYRPPPRPPRRPAEFDRGRRGVPIVIAPEYLKLSEVEDPPRYAPAASDDASAVFAAGMKAYVSGDYADAVIQLNRARSEHPQDIETNFFLGVSALLNNDAGFAASNLRLAFERGPSPYRGLAGIYLGKALVRRADYDGAARVWQRAGALKEPHADEANELLRRLVAIRNERPS